MPQFEPAAEREPSGGSVWALCGDCAGRRPTFSQHRPPSARAARWDSVLARLCSTDQKARKSSASTLPKAASRATSEATSGARIIPVGGPIAFEDVGET